MKKQEVWPLVLVHKGTNSVVVQLMGKQNHSINKPERFWKSPGVLPGPLCPYTGFLAAMFFSYNMQPHCNHTLIFLHPSHDVSENGTTDVGFHFH